jgi:hypothetical protein
VVKIYKGIPLSLKKRKGILTLAWMTSEDIILSDISQSQKNKDYRKPLESRDLWFQRAHK